MADLLAKRTKERPARSAGSLYPRSQECKENQQIAARQRCELSMCRGRRMRMTAPVSSTIAKDGSGTA